MHRRLRSLQPRPSRDVVLNMHEKVVPAVLSAPLVGCDAPPPIKYETQYLRIGADFDGPMCAGTVHEFDQQVEFVETALDFEVVGKLEHFLRTRWTLAPLETRWAFEPRRSGLHQGYRGSVCRCRASLLRHCARVLRATRHCHPSDRIRRRW